MWKCKKCGTEWAFARVEPAIDDGGIHFVCSSCQHRNPLINMGEKGGQLMLAQQDFDWPPRDPKA